MTLCQHGVRCLMNIKRTESCQELQALLSSNVHEKESTADAIASLGDYQSNDWKVGVSERQEEFGLIGRFAAQLIWVK